MRNKTSSYQFRFNVTACGILYKQISQVIAGDIEKGILQKNFQLPSINEFSQKYAVGRDTVEKAYSELKKLDYITSFPGKGSFVTGKKGAKIKVLLVFNKLSSYKKIIYDALIKTLGTHAQVDLHIHHYDPALLKEIIENNLGKYNYYVIMPHFFRQAKEKDYLSIFNSIPPNELVLLDKNMSGVDHTMAVYQNFKYDFYHYLVSSKERVKNYQRLKMVFPGIMHHPVEIIEGVRDFCRKAKMPFSLISDLEGENINSGTLYIVIEDPDLAKLIKKVRTTKFKLGNQVGIISFNETDLKELLNITVITTDFQLMGESVGKMILTNRHDQIKNPFKIIVRASL
jgi:DNA-binding transcriptional regulator YhcF (GntR family)